MEHSSSSFVRGPFGPAAFLHAVYIALNAARAAFSQKKQKISEKIFSAPATALSRGENKNKGYGGTAKAAPPYPFYNLFCFQDLFFFVSGGSLPAQPAPAKYPRSTLAAS